MGRPIAGTTPSVPNQPSPLISGISTSDAFLLLAGVLLTAGPFLPFVSAVTIFGDIARSGIEMSSGEALLITIMGVMTLLAALSRRVGRAALLPPLVGGLLGIWYWNQLNERVDETGASGAIVGVGIGLWMVLGGGLLGFLSGLRREPEVSPRASAAEGAHPSPPAGQRTPVSPPAATPLHARRGSAASVEQRIGILLAGTVILGACFIPDPAYTLVNGWHGYALLGVGAALWLLAPFMGDRLFLIVLLLAAGLGCMVGAIAYFEWLERARGVGPARVNFAIVAAGLASVASAVMSAYLLRQSQRVEPE